MDKRTTSAMAKKKKVRKPDFLYSDFRKRGDSLIIDEKRLHMGDRQSDRERLSINFVLKKGHDGRSLEEVIMMHVLAMSIDDRSDKVQPRAHPFSLSVFEQNPYVTLTEDKRELSRLLAENEKVVKIVIRNLFRWFGTNVGSGHLDDLIMTMKEWDSYSSKMERLEMEERLQKRKRDHQGDL